MASDTTGLVAGMLYVVDVRMVCIETSEKIRHRLLMVGCEQQDIERKLSWVFDRSKYREFSVSAIEKIREKVHFLHTTITAPEPVAGPVVEVGERTVSVPQQQTQTEAYDPNLYAIGVSTSMLAKDPDHALRKLGRALIARATEGQSHTAPALSSDSQIQVSQIPKRSGYAKARDVSTESNKAHMVRG
jgi:hypothetical protein